MRAGSDWSLHPQLVADTHVVQRWALSDVLLMNDERYPWLILVPRVPAATELVDLAPAQSAQLLEEITRASRLLQRAVQPHKLNVAALGNVVSQLHIHVIARYTGDAAWPRPVWGTGAAEPYAAERLAQRLDLLRMQCTHE